MLVNSPLFSRVEALGNTRDDYIIPDVVNPEIYFANLKSSYPGYPERRLMLAILVNALATYQACLKKMAVLQGKRRRDPKNKQSGDFKNKYRKQEALICKQEKWFNGKSMVWLFSFENICDELKISSDKMRNEIATWKKKLLASNGNFKLPRFILNERQSGLGSHFIREHRNTRRRLNTIL